METDPRVLQVLDLIATGKYVDGETPRRLAKEWGLSKQTVSDTVTRAFQYRRLAERKDIRDKIAMLLSRLDADRELALKSVKVVFYKGKKIATIPDPNVSAAIQATKLYMGALGILVRQPGDSKGQQKPIDSMSAGELREMLEHGEDALRELKSAISEKEQDQEHVQH